MTLFKKILIAGGAGIVLFTGLLVYALTDTIRDVSRRSPLNYFINKSVTLKRPGYLAKQEPHQYVFNDITLSPSAVNGGQIGAILPPGTPVVLRGFKTHTHAESGFTALFALGEVTAGGKQVPFEYRWSGLDVLSAPPGTPVALPPAIWQDDTAKKILFTK